MACSCRPLFFTGIQRWTLSDVSDPRHAAAAFRLGCGHDRLCFEKKTGRIALLTAVFAAGKEPTKASKKNDPTGIDIRIFLH